MESKIFHITKTLYGGGGEYALRLSRALINAGYNSKVFSLDEGLLPADSGALGNFHTGYDRVLTSIINRRSTAPFSSSLRISRFRPVDEISSNDIVHLHSITGFIGSRGLRSLIPKGAKVFWTAHNPWTFTAGCVLYQGCDLYQSGCNACPILKFPVRSLSRLEYREKANFIKDYNVHPIANSKWMASMIKSSPWFSNVEEIPVIKPIVDACFNEGDDRSKRELSASDRKMIIGLGARSLTDNYKGIKEFFENLPADAPWIKKVKFVLFGEGTLRLPPNLDVEMLGALRTSEIMADAYRSMDLYVSPTFMETFGMTLVEAQSCGTPVLAFSTGATPEAVCPGAGRLVNNGDFGSLYELLGSLCERGDLLNQGLTASQWVTEHHASNVIAAEQIRIYNSF